MFRIDLPRIFGALVALYLLQPVYAAHKFPDYPVLPADDYSIKVERLSLIIGVEPVEDLKVQKSYFNTELTPKGFLPVFIVIQNESSSDSFIFERANVQYAGVSNNSTADVEPEGGAVSDVVNVPAISNSMRFIAAAEIQENLLKKEVQNKTLSPGTSVHGFLYIPVNKKGSRERVRLQVPIVKVGTRETHVYNLLF